MNWPPRARVAAGLSLVEMLIGIAIGLFIVAGATLVLTTQLNDNRRLLLEVQVQQDLRSAADIVTRELRRAGYSNTASQGVYTPSRPVARNGMTALSTDVGGSGSGLMFNYQRESGAENFGFKVDGGVIKTKLAGSTGWQDLTDANTVRITDFTITPQNGPAVQVSCPKACPAPTGALPAGTTAENYCWPTFMVRDLVITIAGQAVSDPAVERSLRSIVRLRNDSVQFNANPADPDQACPA